MKTPFSTLYLISALAVASSLSVPAFATEYVFRDLLGNTIASPKCADKSEAAANASEPYNVKKYMKRFCEVQGYGWHVAEEKSNGKLICEECSGDAYKGKYQCHLEDVLVTCKRIKPGTVGLFPGQG